uniref:NADH-ubiquinone oxidoreductase chain 2 n=1 Tax=Kiwa tyleri TaxID=1676998 RepID=A0A343CXB7_KIWTY|nr:NADH dehydrogenase subunit 2 [Kiwa tyleri]ARQ27012.1 NADH dehydrogenase subunit 2 [Kiwa tyleri]
MIYLSSLNMMFYFTLMLGTFLTLSSSSWFNAWVGLELNLLSFIPLILSKNNKYSSEAALKYFLIQALGSSFIIFTSSILFFSSFFPLIMICSSLILKLGAAPFHFWLPQIMEGLNWLQLIILMTIQKLAPLFLLNYLMNFNFIIYIILFSSMLSAFIGAILGMNQTSLRKMMAFSSINHMAWMLTAMIISENILLFYFLFYCVISSSVALLFYYEQIYYLNHLMNLTNNSTSSKMILFMSMLSLGGLPPFSGFMPKWILIQEMMNFKLFIPLIILLISTLITLYFYLRITIFSFLFSSSKMKQSLMLNKYMMIMIYIFLFMNMFSLLIPSSMIFF